MSIKLIPHAKGFGLRITPEQAHVAMQYGAKWDVSKSMWYVPHNIDIAEFTKALGGLDASAVAAQITQATRVIATHAAQDAKIKYSNGLDPYQRVGVAFAANAQRCIIADDIGLGKTPEAIRAAMEVGAKKILVITKKSLIQQWISAIEQWDNL